MRTLSNRVIRGVITCIIHCDRSFWLPINDFQVPVHVYRKKCMYYFSSHQIMLTSTQQKNSDAGTHIHINANRTIQTRCTLFMYKWTYTSYTNCLYCSDYRCLYVYANDVDECLSSPCQNGGTCNNLENIYTCNCPTGTAGYNCQTGNLNKFFAYDIIFCGVVKNNFLGACVVGCTCVATMIFDGHDQQASMPLKFRVRKMLNKFYLMRCIIYRQYRWLRR